MDLVQALNKSVLITRDALTEAIDMAFSDEENWWYERLYAPTVEYMEKQKSNSSNKNKPIESLIKFSPEKDIGSLDLAACISFLLDMNHKKNLSKFAYKYNLDEAKTRDLLFKIRNTIRNILAHLTANMEADIDIPRANYNLYDLKEFLSSFDKLRAQQIVELQEQLDRQPRTVQEISQIYNITIQEVMNCVYELKLEYNNDVIMIDKNFDRKLLKLLKRTDTESEVKFDIKEAAQRKENEQKMFTNKIDFIANSQMADILKSHQVFITADVFMSDGFDIFIQTTVIPALKSEKKHVFILDSTINELLKVIMIKDTEEYSYRDERKRARQAYRTIRDLYVNKLCLVVGEDDDGPFEQNVLLQRLSENKNQISPCVFTQDRMMANDIKEIYKNAQTDCLTYKITENGNIIPNNESKENVPDLKKTNTDKAQRASKEKYVPMFELHTEVSDVEREVIPNTFMPYEGDVVFSEKHGSIVLGKEFASGGEGRIFETDKSSIIAKIYKKERITADRLLKLELMTRNHLNISEVCWPLDILENKNGEFVGYIMPQGKGIKLYSLLVNPQILKKYFPDWTRRNLVKLSITILEVFQKLHKENILVGDVNLYNILVENENEVYFVDCDSFQIENYQSTVGTEGFVAPEIVELFNSTNLGELNFSKFMRTLKMEYFAISSLLFHILFLGKGPYAAQGGESITSCTVKRSFAYPFGGRKPDNAPAGTWRYIWSNLNFAMKEMFDNIFAKDLRYDDAYMIKKLRNYLYDIETKEQISDELIPTKYKETVDTEFVTLICKECHKEFNQDIDTYDRNSIRMKDEDMICQICRQAINAARQSLYVYHCEQCGTEVEISKWDIARYRDKGINPPRVCGNCKRMKYSTILKPTSQIHTGTRTSIPNTNIPKLTIPKAGPFKRFSRWYGRHKIFNTFLLILLIVSWKYIKQNGINAYIAQVKFVFDVIIALIEKLFYGIGILLKNIKEWANTR